MPNNQSRREAAKRKLERQLAARAEQSRKNLQRLVIGGVIAVLLVGGGIAWLVTRPAASTADPGATTSSGAETAPAADPCAYLTEGVAPAVKEVERPGNGSPLNSGTVEAEITLNGTAVPITLDRAIAPCGVNSFLSLASQGFYDETDCWRLTDHPELKILQCGDPSGQGNGGPGYGFQSETGEMGATYPRGTIALANATQVPNSTGSQFFIAYEDSLPASPSYTVIGTVSEAGLAAVDAVADEGVTDGLPSGKPAGAARIDSVTVPDDALDGSGDYPEPSAEPSLDMGDLGDLSGLESVPTG